MSLVPSKVMEEVILTVITLYLWELRGQHQSQHGFRKGMSCLNNLVSFYDQMTHLVDASASAKPLALSPTGFSW